MPADLRKRAIKEGGILKWQIFINSWQTIKSNTNAVELIFDKILWAKEIFQFHPLVNTSTLLISRENLKRFFGVTGHEVRLLDIPSQD